MRLGPGAGELAVTLAVRDEALAQRKQKMNRTHRDMKYFFATIESLRRHRKRSEFVLFEDFLRPVEWLFHAN